MVAEAASGCALESEGLALEGDIGGGCEPWCRGPREAGGLRVEAGVGVACGGAGV